MAQGPADHRGDGDGGDGQHRDEQARPERAQAHERHLAPGRPAPAEHRRRRDGIVGQRAHPLDSKSFGPVVAGGVRCEALGFVV
ncbi:MAG TPA: hypothetical protein VHB30_15020, partial [Solirubrobacteraceae bacterium]|nr:hypothetical protein [Solirubrobacteraceae bacterium]